ncbi:MAG: hypothetical protein WDW36_008330 [Sanguina aurantia]
MFNLQHERDWERLIKAVDSMSQYVTQTVTTLQVDQQIFITTFTTFATELRTAMDQQDANTATAIANAFASTMASPEIIVQGSSSSNEENLLQVIQMLTEIQDTLADESSSQQTSTACSQTLQKIRIVQNDMSRHHTRVVSLLTQVFNQRNPGPVPNPIPGDALVPVMVDQALATDDLERRFVMRGDASTQTRTQRTPPSPPPAPPCDHGQQTHISISALRIAINQEFRFQAICHDPAVPPIQAETFMDMIAHLLDMKLRCDCHPQRIRHPQSHLGSFVRPARMVPTYINGIRHHSDRHDPANFFRTWHFLPPRDMDFPTFNQLGLSSSWKLSDALDLKWTDGDKWTATIDLPAGSVYEYKYVLIDYHSKTALSWQGGNNSVLALGGADGAVEVSDNWGNSPDAGLVANGVKATRESKLQSWASEMMGFKSQAQQSQLEVQRKNEELALQKMQINTLKMELSHAQEARKEGEERLQDLEQENLLLKAQVASSQAAIKSTLEEAMKLLAQGELELSSDLFEEMDAEDSDTEAWEDEYETSGDSSWPELLAYATLEPSSSSSSSDSNPQSQPQQTIPTPSSLPAAGSASQSASPFASQPESAFPSQSATQPASSFPTQSASQPASQSASRPASVTAGQPASQSASQSASQPASQSASQPPRSFSYHEVDHSNTFTPNSQSFLDSRESSGGDTAAAFTITTNNDDNDNGGNGAPAVPGARAGTPGWRALSDTPPESSTPAPPIPAATPSSRTFPSKGLPHSGSGSQSVSASGLDAGSTNSSGGGGGGGGGGVRRGTRIARGSVSRSDGPSTSS